MPITPSAEATQQPSAVVGGDTESGPVSSQVNMLLEELRRRKVFRAACAYLAAAFIIVQVADLTFEPLGFTPGAYRVLVILTAVGFPLCILLSWLFELRVEHTVGSRQQNIVLTGVLLLGAIGVAGFAVWRWPEARNATAAVPFSASDASASVARAKYYLVRTNPAELDSAIRILEGVVRDHPDHAQAHAQLGIAYMYKASFFSEDAAYEQNALIAAEKALALDPNIPEAHVVRGRMVWLPANGFAHEQSIREYKRAIQLDPANSEAWFQLGQVYTHVGSLDRALAAYDSALVLNAVDPRGRVARGQALFYGGDVVSALDIYKQAPITYSPTIMGYQIAWAYERLGRLDDARRVLDDYMSRFKDDAGLLNGMYAVVQVRQGMAGEALKKLQAAKKARQNSVHFHHAEFSIGMAHALLGQSDSALVWLTRAADEGLPCHPLFASEPNLASLHHDERFRALLADLRRRQTGYEAL